MNKRKAKQLGQLHEDLNAFALGLLYEQTKRARREWEKLAIQKLEELGVALCNAYLLSEPLKFKPIKRGKHG